MKDVTLLLSEVEAGHPGAADELFPLVYEQLRALARSFFIGERRDHSLQPTALVHEAYLRLVGDGDSGAQTPRTRAQFCALAATVMRHVLVDHARTKSAAKRGGAPADRLRITLSGVQAHAPAGSDLDFEELDAALTELAALSERSARVVELRFFGGMTLDDAAGLLGISLSSAEREWRFARAWLLERLSTRIDE